MHERRGGAMRLLHAGDRRGRRRPVRPQPQSQRTARSGRRWRGTSADAPGTGRSCALRRPVADRGAMTSTTDTAPRDPGPGRRGGRSPLAPTAMPKLQRRVRIRPGPERRGDALGGHRAQPARPRSHRSIDVGPGAGDWWCSRRAHRRATSREGPTFGLEHADQPVLAADEARFWGSRWRWWRQRTRRPPGGPRPRWWSRYRELEPLIDPEEADRRDEVFRRLAVRTG